MSVSSNIATDGNSLVIQVEGRFDFSEHEAFRQCYELQGNKPDRFVVDLRQTSYLDSSARGMLLLLRDYAGGDEASVEIINCSQDVKKIFSISNFDQLFAIH